MRYDVMLHKYSCIGEIMRKTWQTFAYRSKQTIDFIAPTLKLVNISLNLTRYVKHFQRIHSILENAFLGFPQRL